MDTAMPPQLVLIPYRLRAVRVGILVTVLTVAVLAAAMALPGNEALRSPGYLCVLLAGALGAAVIALLPWPSLFERGIGLRFLYAWSAADITLVSLAIAATHGRSPELFIVYALTTVFFGVAYPPRAQVGLVAFTFAAYLGALAMVGWHTTAAAVFIRLAMLGVLAVLTYFLSSDLMREIARSEEARAQSERWASMLSSVAASAHRMSLDRVAVLDAAAEAVLGLGFDAFALCALSEDGDRYRIVRAGGIAIGDVDADDDSPEMSASNGVVGSVVAAGSGAVLGHADAVQGQPDGAVWDGLTTIVAMPIWVDGWLGAVLVAAVRGEGDVPGQQADALELVGTQLGLAFDNIARFEREHRMVERLADLDRMKGDFLTTVSHELRSPVTVIKGVGLTLERNWDALDPELRAEMIGGLTKNASSLEGLIANLLDLSRLDTGATDVGFDVFDLSEVLERVADRFEVRHADHPLRRVIRPRLVVEGEATMIERVVENLLSNAGTHTPPSTNVELSAIQEEEVLRVTVQDHGPGVPSEDVEHLGERFYRAGDINTRPKGLGLGLALAREMLQLHGSELMIESERGSGTTVSFALRSVLPERDARPGIITVDPSVNVAEGR